jgi:hypothetical protein
MSNNITSFALVLTRNGLGDSDPELQQILVKNYFALLIKEEFLPDFICFYANAVKLTCTGSPIIEELKELEKRGAKLIICKTCLNYFNIIEQVKVGMIGTMHDIVDIQFRAGKVLSL